MSSVDFSAYQDKYNLGKGDFRNFREGIEKEWLISNGIGGYANATVIGSNSRSFSSLLNVSLNHPVLQISEVGTYEGEVGVGYHVALRIGILVEAVEMGSLAESR